MPPVTLLVCFHIPTETRICANISHEAGLAEAERFELSERLNVHHFSSVPILSVYLHFRNFYKISAVSLTCKINSVK
jgi:hypothetical protein